MYFMYPPHVTHLPVEDIRCCESCFDGKRIYALMAAREADKPYGPIPHAIHNCHPHCHPVSTKSSQSKPFPNTSSGKNSAPPAPSNSGVAFISCYDPWATSGIPTPRSCTIHP